MRYASVNQHTDKCIGYGTAQKKKKNLLQTREYYVWLKKKKVINLDDDGRQTREMTPKNDASLPLPRTDDEDDMVSPKEIYFVSRD